MSGVVIYTDGAARGNPGPAGIGYLIYDEAGQVLVADSDYLGETTNNVAEYTALLRALEKAQILSGGPVQVYSDSELMVRQLNGVYQVKHPGLLPLYNEARRLLAGFNRWSITHVPREKNKEADRLSNEGIDRHVGGSSHLPAQPPVVE
ncbi:MAG: ribonuclease HI family protein [Chitinophagales bacterium]